MKINKYLNCTKAEFKSGAHNIFLGLSLGNKFFRDNENIYQLLRWSLENSKDSVAVVIPDNIHAINYQIRSKNTKDRSIKRALKKGIEMKGRVKSVCERFGVEDNSRIFILHWVDVQNDNGYGLKRDILYSEFEKHGNLYERILEVVSESIRDIGRELSHLDREQLAQYVLDELPVLINGFEYHDTVFNVLPYPGTSIIDELVIDLQEGRSFPELTRTLDIFHKTMLVDVCAE